MLRFALSLLLLLPTLAHATHCTGRDLLSELPVSAQEALRAEAARMPYHEGLLWQARKGAQTLTLFGSFHLPHEYTEAQTARLMPFAEAADLTYFEMDAKDTKAFERLSSTDQTLLFVPSGQPTLPELLTEAEWKDLSAKLLDRGTPPFMAAKMKPMFVSMMLGMSPCFLREMKQGEAGIDRRLAERLAAKDLPTASIENVRTVMKLFDAYPPEKQIELLRLSLVMDENPDDVTETLYQAYIREETGLIWEYSKQLSLESGGTDSEEDFALFETLLLTRRNLDWMDKLAKTAVDDLLIVVGAGHLPGEKGLLNLLAQKGYTITRLETLPKD